MRTLIVVLLLRCLASADDQKFPNEFKFGVATSAYQVEGAWNVNGKGQNIWDTATHYNNFIVDNSTGDVACDAYHKTDTDVNLLKNLGVHFYRFSISWSRILPYGFANDTNPDGIHYYNNLINKLLQNGIQPMVTIFHWDLPQSLQDLGGWTNPLMSDYLLDYAKVLFNQFGDRVKYWITINEAQILCTGGYEGSPLMKLAPDYNSPGIGPYLCGHTLLISHYKVYRYYQKHLKEKQKGKVGITHQSIWYEPNSKNKDDVNAAETKLQFELGWFAHPIFSKYGDYPSVMKQRIGRLSKEQNYPRSRLPTFTMHEIRELRGSADFLGYNHYTTRICKPGTNATQPSLESDAGVTCFQNSSWPSSSAPWLKVVPWGFRKILNWIRTQYNNIEVIVTENGFADRGDINDCGRVKYMNSYLEELRDAINKDGCNVTAYIAWSFIDNFEWASGYTQKFGLYHVDFNSPNRTRTAKRSSYNYQNIIKTGKIDKNYQPPGFQKCT
nr:myrosinase 1-like [Onthophagus taurus]